MFTIGSRPRTFQKLASSLKTAVGGRSKAPRPPSGEARGMSTGGQSRNNADGFGAQSGAHAFGKAAQDALAPSAPSARAPDTSAAIGWDRTHPRAGNALARSNALGKTALANRATARAGVSLRGGQVGQKLAPNAHAPKAGSAMDAALSGAVSPLERLAQATLPIARAPEPATPAAVDVDEWAKFG